MNFLWFTKLIGELLSRHLKNFSVHGFSYFRWCSIRRVHGRY